MPRARWFNNWKIVAFARSSSQRWRVIEVRKRQRSVRHGATASRHCPKITSRKGRSIHILWGGGKGWDWGGSVVWEGGKREVDRLLALINNASRVMAHFIQRVAGSIAGHRNRGSTRLIQLPPVTSISDAGEEIGVARCEKANHLGLIGGHGDAPRNGVRATSAAWSSGLCCSQRGRMRSVKVGLGAIR